MILERTDFKESGIFGTLRFDDGDEFCKTLEHAYPKDGIYYPKLPGGTYRCVKGVHRLSHSRPFTTFEVVGVPGHSGILFHSGNFNKDSDGCILLGEKIVDNFLVRSRTKFVDFLEVFAGIQTFQLTVY